jgi:hypothetical protein
MPQGRNVDEEVTMTLPMRLATVVTLGTFSGSGCVRSKQPEQPEHRYPESG